MVGLYLHIPFCISKCHYCSFNSVVGKSRFVSDYLEAMKKEMEFYAPQLRGREVGTIFVGGGTPSLLLGAQVETLLNAARRAFAVSCAAEITLEANPGSLDAEKLQGYRAAGVNRVSLGAQSFHADELKWLGRTHTVEETQRSVEVLRQFGFENFNLDLIFGLPGQTLASWQENVQQAVELSPKHLSLYHLTIEEGSTFHDVKKLIDPSDEEGARCFEWTREFLAAAGFEQYEISNFARAGFRCRHNQIYWRNEDCLGIGAGAWTYLDDARYLRPKSVEAYIKDVKEGKFSHLEKEMLDVASKWRETLVFGLRMPEGVNLAQLESRFGRGPDAETAAALDRLQDAGFLTQEKDTVRLTPRGLLFADTVAVELL